MNCLSWIEDLAIPLHILDDKKQQTDYKIQYIVEYVKHWLLVMVNRKDVSNINFIDCMCNAGIYVDGDLGTAMQVLMLFKEYSKQHHDKKFSLYLNDYDAKRIEVIKSVAKKILGPERPNNFSVYMNTQDVNDYLSKFQYTNPYRGMHSTILFVDPYDFGTVKIPLLTEFARNFYAEIVFNLFSSDYVRNYRTDPDRIISCLGENLDIEDPDKLVAYIREKLCVGRIRHVFFYQFYNKKNTELYQIVFATPSPKGLQKLKESLWIVFGGKAYHRNVDTSQTSLFDSTLERESMLSDYAVKAKSLLMRKFAGCTVSYNDIDIFLLENTMMRSTDIINNVLRPLIMENRITKLELVSNKSNFKDDKYFFKEVPQS